MSLRNPMRTSEPKYRTTPFCRREPLIKTNPKRLCEPDVGTTSMKWSEPLKPTNPIWRSDGNNRTRTGGAAFRTGLLPSPPEPDAPAQGAVFDEDDPDRSGQDHRDTDREREGQKGRGRHARQPAVVLEGEPGVLPQVPAAQAAQSGDHDLRGADRPLKEAPPAAAGGEPGAPFHQPLP